MTATNPDSSPALSPVTLAAVDLLRRTGSADFELRWSEPESETSPLVWIAIASYRVGRDGRPRPRGPINAHRVACDLNPEQAVYNLAESVIDGARCTHCNRPTGFSADLSDMPLDKLICWYQFDPELKTFRRSCEGD